MDDSRYRSIIVIRNIEVSREINDVIETVGAW